MAKFAGACGWITTAARDVHNGVGNIENYVLRKNNIPEDVRSILKDAQLQMNRAASRLYEASRALIEADAAELSRKEDRQ